MFMENRTELDYLLLCESSQSLTQYRCLPFAIALAFLFGIFNKTPEHFAVHALSPPADRIVRTETSAALHQRRRYRLANRRHRNPFQAVRHLRLAGGGWVDG